jgi:four helix bundle protein
MNSKEQFITAMRDRTKKLAVDTIKHYRTLPQAEEAKIVGKQLVRSATSVAANFRTVCRARSKKEFFAKLSITVEESNDFCYLLIPIYTHYIKHTWLNRTLLTT